MTLKEYTEQIAYHKQEIARLQKEFGSASAGGGGYVSISLMPRPYHLANFRYISTDKFSFPSPDYNYTANGGFLEMFQDNHAIYNGGYVKWVYYQWNYGRGLQPDSYYDPTKESNNVTSVRADYPNGYYYGGPECFRPIMKLL